MNPPTKEEMEAWDLLFGGMTHTEICVRINEFFIDKFIVDRRREYQFILSYRESLGHLPAPYEIKRNKEMGIGRPNKPW